MNAESITALLAEQTDEAAMSLATPFRVLALSECATAQPRPALIKGLIRPGDVALIIGAPGTGKSVLAPYLGHRINTGQRIFGRRVRKAPVLYVAAEDGAGMILRGAALLRTLGDAPGLRLIPDQLDLMTPEPPPNVLAPEGHDPMPADAKALRRIADHYRVGAIFLDTLAACFPGLQENEAAAMDHVVRVARYLAANGAAVVLVHHVTKGGGTTPRGHGRLDGDADLTLLVEAQEGSPVRTVRMGKNRSGSSLERFAFTIRSEHLGDDADGDAITAPVAEEEEAAAPSRKGDAERRLSDSNAILIRELRATFAALERQHATPLPGMASIPVIGRVSLRSALIRAAWYRQDELRDGVSEPGNAITRPGQTREHKALEALKSKGLANFTRDWAWLT
jgi:hypothetical protein